MKDQSLGRHVLVELYGCTPEILNDVIKIEQSMVAAAQKAEATVINSTFHHFSPFGVSGVVVIQESHLAIHTWPEFGYAAIDIFTCGETVNPWISYNYMKLALEAEHGSAMEMKRGQENLLPKVDFDQEPARDEYSRQIVDPTYKRNIWFTERDENIAFSLRHKGEVLFRGKSPFQKVEVYDTYSYGKMLTLDGLVMCTEKDEYVYHELITHIGMLTHPDPKRVLVIGGGDGGTVRELVKHKALEKVTMVEIDEMVIKASKKHLPTLSSAFNHPKLELIIGDGIEYLEKAKDASFDIIIVDNSDPVGPSEGIFTPKFYKNAYRALKSDGLLIGQSESPRFNVRVYKELYKVLKDIFGKDKVHCFLGHIPTYPSGMWSFSYCSKGDVHPLHNMDEERSAQFSNEHKLKYYNEDIHRAAFALPNFAKTLLEEAEKGKVAKKEKIEKVSAN